MAGVFAGWWVLSYMQLHLPIRDQDAVITIPDPVQARAKVLSDLEVMVKGDISTKVPLDQVVSVPVQETLNTMIHFDHEVPIKLDVPVKDIIPVDQTITLDTHVKVNVLGKDIKLPLKGTIPIKLQVPINFTVPINQNIRVTFDAPAQAKLKQNIHVPLKTTIDTTIPIHGMMQVPVKSELNAQVVLADPIPAKILQSDLVIPLNNLGLKEKVNLPPPVQHELNPAALLSEALGQ